jgi:hypothetical protein
MTCPRSEQCGFYEVVSASVVKRVKHASAFIYCRGGRHESCAVHRLLADGAPVPAGLMPDGTVGDWAEDALGAATGRAAAGRFLIIEDAPVFAALAAAAIANHFPGAEVERCATYDEAEPRLLTGRYTAVVCGFGLGGNRTAHDVRRLTNAPIVVLTGRPDEIEVPVGAQVVRKGAGSEALVSALRACIG